jgi:hypothetical protein
MPQSPSAFIEMREERTRYQKNKNRTLFHFTQRQSDVKHSSWRDLAGLVGGEGFAVDARLIEADANRSRSMAREEVPDFRDPKRRQDFAQCS